MTPQHCEESSASNTAESDVCATSIEDARAFLQRFPTGHTDMVLTSPPYGVAVPYEGGSTFAFAGIPAQRMKDYGIE